MFSILMFFLRYFKFLMQCQRKQIWDLEKKVSIDSINKAVLYDIVQSMQFCTSLYNPIKILSYHKKSICDIFYQLLSQARVIHN